jgi:hypothetical protein
MQGIELFVRGVGTYLLSNQLSGTFLGESARVKASWGDYGSREKREFTQGRVGCPQKCPHGAPIEGYRRSQL